MAAAQSKIRPAHVLTALLFAVSAIATFYTGLAFALGDFWGTERSRADNAAGASALILLLAMIVAIISGIGARSDGRNSPRTMTICLVVGLLVAFVPWLWIV